MTDAPRYLILLAGDSTGNHLPPPWATQYAEVDGMTFVAYQKLREIYEAATPLWIRATRFWHYLRLAPLTPAEGQPTICGGMLVISGRN